VEPYTIRVPQHRLTTIKAQIDAFDWSELPDAGGWSAGVGLADLRRLVDHWQHRYDWRATERRLNALPNFTLDVEGERVHFVFVKGHGDKPPILLLHGWPGSYLEFEAVIGPLAAAGHDVVVPSLPGFAFSKPISGVLGPRRIAQLMHGLMQRLFDKRRYVVQGGDWGAHIASWMAYLQPTALLGIHINMMTIFAEGTAPRSQEEKDHAARTASARDGETGYSLEQETRPQTLGVAMSNSPVGVAGWILEKFGKWADLPTSATGDPDLWSKFTEDELLDQIMLYVAPSAAVTATWIYLGKRLEGSSRFPAGTRVEVPVGFAAFPDPVFLPPLRSFAEQTYNIVHWTTMPRGGHFAAWEQPALLLGDLQSFIEKLTG
jgi:pimeloyl-ACP methyl ester carboxylesterase